MKSDSLFILLCFLFLSGVFSCSDNITIGGESPIEDTDEDGIEDSEDNCVNISNPGQEDADGDGIGDACEEDETDTDGDGVIDSEDNCPDVANENQADQDEDGTGDACDPDQLDSDEDGIVDSEDNCPEIANADQADTDGDGTGDVCEEDETDTDGDGVIDSEDNCPNIANEDQADEDGDGTGDACEVDGTDTDGDGVIDSEDNCPETANEDQADEDEDGTGDVCESDASGFELIITGVIDGPLTGGLPKAIELYVNQDIENLSVFAIGSANNGEGTDGLELSLSGSATSGDFIYIATESEGFNQFFGINPDYTHTAANIDGDDAIQLYKNSVVIDTFGEIEYDITELATLPWIYTDGWAYRKTHQSPGGTSFSLSHWNFSGSNILDDETNNEDAASPFPIGTFQP